MQPADQQPAATPQPGEPSLPARTFEPPRREIVLPDIRIPASAKAFAIIDTTSILKQQLENAERELRQLQLERNRILKALEQFENRSLKARRPPLQRSTGFIGRPSV
ncbi:MAG: hypothetical protein ONB44_01285 [candidate division KSB1 bacterium]|nr:hypothetical protein [candidate division KSB1 bacterium]MDZ7300753.1 hypothetical protein [candidate division KSB1 bacterium]MDZ7309977.1 hypothetical protein [candidate division KSB1 bacterium]